MPNNSKDYPSNEVYLAVLLEHPDFSGFTERGGDYRDWSEKNPGLSLSLERGWFDHKAGQGGHFFELVKELGLLDQARERAGLTGPKQKKSTSTPKKPPTPMFPDHDPNEDTLTGNLFDQPAQNSSNTADFARDLWQHSEDKSARQKVQGHLDSRSIPQENYLDLLGTHIRCVADRGGHFLIMAMLTPEQASQAAAGSVPQSIQKIHRVHLSEADRPKRQLGSPTDNVGRVSYLPPFSANGESLQYLVCEGLEDALSIRSRYRDHHFLVCQSKGNLKHIPAFLPEGATVLIISDHDGHEEQNQNGEFESAKLRRDLRSRGYVCTALMPPEPKSDANDALRANRLEQWLSDLIEVPDLPRSRDDFFFEPRTSLRIREPDWLVQGVLEKGTLAAIVGESGSGKSFLAIDLACSVATGRNWHGNPTQKGAVFYLAGEGRSGISRRLGAWEHHTQSSSVPMMFSSRAIDLGDSRDNLPMVLQALRSSSQKPVLIIIDTLARHHSGDENSASEMSAFINNLDQLREEFGATVIIVHHAGKDLTRGARGSSAFRAALDHELAVTKPETGMVNLQCTKAKDAEPFAPMGFRLLSVDVVDEQGRLLAEPDGTPITSCVLEPAEYVKKQQAQNPTDQQQVFIEAFEELRQSSANPDRVLTAKLRKKVQEKLPDKGSQEFKGIWRNMRNAKMLNSIYDIGETVVIERTNPTD